jgi:DNA-binding transcriptional LysR family regulator
MFVHGDLLTFAGELRLLGGIAARAGFLAKALDGVSLDQLRIFVAAADDASFTAAGRRLNRAQSAISHSIANLECQLGVRLFDRSEKFPRLTLEGRALLTPARGIVQGVQALKVHAHDMAGGLEPELSVVIDVMFPQKTLTKAISAFAKQFPATNLRLYAEALGAVAVAVLEQRCSVGVIGTLPDTPPALTKERLLTVPLVSVVAPSHPFASLADPIPTEIAERHIQLVLTDRSHLTMGRDMSVIAKQSWRLADLGAKHAFLREGLGWGHMPLPAVEEDIARGILVPITIEGTPAARSMPMSAIYRADAPPGRAGRWLIDHLKAPRERSKQADRPQVSIRSRRTRG